jgi:hypothetical protein
MLPDSYSLISYFELKEKFSRCIVQFNKLVVDGRCMQEKDNRLVHEWTNLKHIFKVGNYK